jgi:hypothetical protein
MMSVNKIGTDRAKIRENRNLVAERTRVVPVSERVTEDCKRRRTI